ncbi:MAG TPA: MBL fold metallo-hydrolase [bacterium]|nr:MBL fold metallo-hydrolase [bacterium]
MRQILILLFFSGSLACAPFQPIHDPFEDQGRSEETAEPGARPLRIDVLDVDQGDATLIIGPGGKTMLIDAGRAGEGLVTVLPFLEAAGVDRLDWIVATHYDADHIGGITEVLRGADQEVGTEDDFFPAEALIDRGGKTDKATDAYEGYAALAAPYRREAEPGMVFPLGDGAEAEVVVVNGRFEDGRQIPLEPDEENEACIGLLITYGSFRYFTAGDLTGGGAPGGYVTKDLETIAGEIVGDVDILHASHHGSESSSNRVFLEETHPEVVVISVGAENDYGHPAATALTRIEDTGATIYRTDRDGAIEIASDGQGYKIFAATASVSEFP